MKTCLVVDDSSVIRKVARRILEGLEFQITEAEDGEGAIEACRNQLPDAILLDWNMPKMDGYEFLRALRRLPGGDKPKVVFCTTENDVAHIARALHAGANEYIMKPFDRDIVSKPNSRKSGSSERSTSGAWQALGGRDSNVKRPANAKA
jgi:two-component system chemotaxis response regulator CheY